MQNHPETFSRLSRLGQQYSQGAGGVCFVHPSRGCCYNCNLLYSSDSWVPEML